MDVSTLEMNKYEAKERLEQYKKALRRKHDDEYERTAAALEALTEGKQVVVLSTTIENAPRDAKLRPRIAIARADKHQVKYYRNRYGNAERFTIYGGNSRGKVARDNSIEVVAGAETPAWNTLDGAWEVMGYALVPLVPPDVKGTRDLSKLFVLWEVEWSDTPLRTTPDFDPYLLKRIADDLYTVEGEWELTEVERAVMRARKS